MKAGQLRILSIVLLAILFLSSFQFPALGNSQQAFSVELSLPEGWSLQDGFEKHLTRNVENRGRWIACSLRAPSGDPVLLQTLPQESSGPLYFPPASGIRTDGSLGMGATYEVVAEDSFRAIAETHPYLGGSVTASLPGGDILILESRTLPLAALLELCRFFAGSETGLSPALQ